jgi:lipoprotein-anchoring transpeptidase ErfK/SrfK
MMISVDEEPEEPPPIRLRLVRGANRVELVQGDRVIRVFPVSVGKPGWETPLGVFHVVQMERDPVFRNPFDPTDVRPPRSPQNPLGPAWIAFWVDGKGTGIGFHGTNLPQLQPSHGCVRMHNHDVTELYRFVSVGTVVEVVR